LQIHNVVRSIFVMRVIFAVKNYNGQGFRFKKEYDKYKHQIPKIGETLIIEDFSFEISRVEWNVSKNECWVICD
jgi:hypothetical protein